MLNDKEKIFVESWEASRLKEKKLVFQLLKGLPVGIVFALPILFILFTARYWYKRADMVANSQLSPGILLFAVLIISVFVAVVFKRHQWEMKEQQYRELKSREDRK